MNSIVVGNGLLAKAFSNSKSDDCIFFCSGVSNSSETNNFEFQREYDLLKESVRKGFCLVYFSSVLAPLERGEYYKHKIRMEELVKSISMRYLIIRLPQVVGDVVNETLFPSFVKKIYFDRTISIYKNATRSIIDVDDVLKLFDRMYENKIINKTVSYCPGYTFQPLELINLIGDFLHKEPKIKVLDKESMQHCNKSELSIMEEDIYGDIDTYLSRIVQKYTDKVINKL